MPRPWSDPGRSGVEVCFSNPGTSEMHFVASLDAVPQLRGVLCLFEGVATGAADGYGRRRGARGHPAAPGAGPGERPGQPAQRPPGRTPLVNVVGDHAYHKRFDAPLNPISTRWPGRCRTGSGAGPRPESPPTPRRRWPRPWGRPAGWPRWSCPPTCRGPTRRARAAVPPRPPSVVPDPVIGRPPAPPAGARAADPAGRRRAAPPRAGGGQPDRRRHRGAAAGRDLPARLEHSAGLPGLERLAYLAEFAQPQLAGTRQLILAGAARRVLLRLPGGCPARWCPAGLPGAHTLARPGEDVSPALVSLAGRIAPGTRPRSRSRRSGPRCPGGGPDPRDGGRGHRRAAPRGRDRVRRGQHLRALRRPPRRRAHPRTTGSRSPAARSARACLVATGAAVACPDRSVLALDSDGSAMQHDPGPVDAGPGGTRRHHGDLH